MNHNGEPSSRPIRIYALFGDGGQHAGRISRGARHEIHFSAHGFDDLVPTPRGEIITVNAEILEKVLLEMEGFDAVFSDSPEAVLLHYVRRRRGMRAMPWLVNEVDFFRNAELIRRFVHGHYGEDPLPEILRAEEVQWFTILDGQRERYERLGLRIENLHFLPMARSSIAFFFPEMIALQDALLSVEGGACPSVAEEGVLALGSHERDYDCLAEALEPTDITADIICNLAHYPRRAGRMLRWHDSQPPDVYLESIRRAAVIVLPLRHSGRAAGQLSCALPMRMAKPILATDVPSLEPMLIHGVTGLTHPAGDSAAMRECLVRLLSNPEEARRFGRAAAEREVALSVIAARSIEEIVKRLGNGGHSGESGDG